MISAVCFTSANPAPRGPGLLGWVSFRCGPLRLTGVAVRRTASGRIKLSYPVSRDPSGWTRCVVAPVDADARRHIEAAVLTEVGLR